MKKEFTLLSKINDFSTVIKNTRCTDHQGRQQEIEPSFTKLAALLKKNTEENQGAVYIIGNGGSATVASHAVTDLINACHLRAFTLHEPALMTCMANDFGYEHAFSHTIRSLMKKNDILIAISCSGNSPNMHQAIKTAKALGSIIITLSGFHANNPLTVLGDFNFWLDSHDYGLVEMGHLFLLHYLTDCIAVGVEKGEKLAYHEAGV